MSKKLAKMLAVSALVAGAALPMQSAQAFWGGGPWDGYGWGGWGYPYGGWGYPYGWGYPIGAYGYPYGYGWGYPYYGAYPAVTAPVVATPKAEAEEESTEEPGGKEEK